MVPTVDDPYAQIRFVPGTGQLYIQKVTEPGRETRNWLSFPSAWALPFEPAEYPSSSPQVGSRLRLFVSACILEMAQEVEDYDSQTSLWRGLALRE